jgi:hypothetical protein
MLEGRRVLTESFLNLKDYRENNIPIPKHLSGEIRILSVDIALLASKKHDNDASCFIINSAMPTSNKELISNFVYVNTMEGLVTEELGLETMRHYYQYECDYLVIDANGIGQSVLDYLMADRFDPEYGVTYKALNVRNNDDLASRCKVSNAEKVIYAIKASQKSNNDMAIALRAGIQNGNINFLISDNVAESYLSKNIKGYNKMNEEKQISCMSSYLQTTYLIDELIKLKHSVVNGLIKLQEIRGMRKDRFSSLEYNYWVTQEIARDSKPKTDDLETLLSKMKIRGSSMIKRRH